MWAAPRPTSVSGLRQAAEEGGLSAAAVPVSLALQNLKAGHRDYLELLRKLRALPGVKRVFIRSGIRFDYVMADPDDTFFKELCRYHISGQLKWRRSMSRQGPSLYGKPAFSVYLAFAENTGASIRSWGKSSIWCPISCPPIRAAP